MTKTKSKNVHCILLMFCLWASIWKLSAQDILVTPQNVTICSGKYATFTVNVPGNPTSYQWQIRVGLDWENIDQPFQGRSLQTNREGVYRCIVRIDSEDHISVQATLTVHYAPSIASVQVPSVCEGNILAASAVGVTNGGYDLDTYIWKLNGIPIEAGPVNNNMVPVLNRVANINEDGLSLSLILSNQCGDYESAKEWVTIMKTPSKPTPVVRDYCLGETAVPLSITEGGIEGSNVQAVWNTVDGTAPTPVTTATGTFTWMVSQKITYPGIVPLNCESARAQATVTVRTRSDAPHTNNNIILCLHDPDPGLKAQGTNIRWYNDQKVSLPTAPQINTSTLTSQIFYITQTETGKCESLIDDGMITIQFKDRANVDDILLSYPYHSPDSPLCPNNSTEIIATSNVNAPTFRWYVNENKTVLIPPHAITTTAQTSTLTTDFLMRDTVYYITLEQPGKCESRFPKAVPIYVRDFEVPVINFDHASAQQYKNIVVNTDAGKCFASNVHIGSPYVRDACTPEAELKLSVYYTEVTLPVPPMPFPLGDSTIIWYVRDAAGYSDYALQNITVRDREKPQGTCPLNIVKDIDESETSAVVSYDFFYTDNYTDNCSGVSYKLFEDSYPSGFDFPLGKHLIRHYISDGAGNVDTCDFYVVVQHPIRPMALFLRVSDNPVCPGQEVVITPEITGGSGKITYSWKPRPWNDPVMRDYPPMGTTTYELTVSDGITFQTKSVDITVLQTELVKLKLEGRPMDEIFEGDEVLVTATKGFDTYKLMLNGQIVQEAGMYNRVSFQAELGTFIVRVFATDDNYCVTQDQMIIEVDSRKLPNVFTPNFDGANDVFLENLETPDAPENFQIEIYNRAGELLYKGNKGWNGYYKGKLLPQGTYVYKVKRRMNSGEYRIFKGNVTLKL